jgi:hypothetical protein
MQLNNYRTLLAARKSGEFVRVRTSSGRVCCGLVQAIAVTMRGAELVGEVVLHAPGLKTHSLDFAALLSVSVIGAPRSSAREERDAP